MGKVEQFDRAINDSDALGNEGINTASYNAIK